MGGNGSKEEDSQRAIAVQKAQDEENKKNVEYQLAQKFSQVSVDRGQLTIAREILANKPMTLWKEKTHHQVIRGVEEDKIDTFLELMSDSLQLPPEEEKSLKSKIKMIKLSKAVHDSPSSVDFELSEFVSVFGFVAAVQDGEGTFAVAYAIHKLTFKAEELTPLQIEAIKQTYCVYKVLHYLKNEGIVKEIKYNDD